MLIFHHLVQKNVGLVFIVLILCGRWTPIQAQSQSSASLGLNEVYVPTDTAEYIKTPLEDIEYKLEASGNYSFDSKHTPFWLHSNRYGLGGITPRNGHVRAGISRSYKNDSNRNWKVGYGLDLVAAHNYTSDFFIQQLYADIAYKNVLLSIGAKERCANLKNDELSTGSQTLGINARPIPEIRFEIPEYISISGKDKWLSIRGHVGYGFTTDGGWQRNFTKHGNRYLRQVLYHSKSGFLRIGNEDKFPLTLEGGVEMAATFGGKLYDQYGICTNLYGGLKDFVKIFFVKGADVGETVYKNALGNTVGSWLFSLKYKGPNWSARFYYDHFFEDHSALFWEYGWKDAIYGLELSLPKNRFVSTVVYEYMYTKYQSGPIYHDHTAAIPDQISAVDNYYNHGIYNGWQHWGQAIGNPLYISPIYNNDGYVKFKSNRFSAHHIGICGDPTDDLYYRLLFTYSQHLGTYAEPLDDKKYQRSFLCELTYSPSRIGRWNAKGWSATAAFGIDRSSLTGNNQGIQFTIRKTGLFSL